VGKRTGKRRGRPRKPDKQPRPTTRAGRQAGFDPHDLGSPHLRAKKVTWLGRVDLELTPAGILLGHGVIDEAEAKALRILEVWLARARRARMLRGQPSVGGLWSALLSGQTGGKWTLPLINTVPGADHAWFRLLQLREYFAAAGELVELGLVLRVAEGVGIPEPLQMGAFQAGLRSVTLYLECGRRRRQA
jgi:hypothetical protein